jgi:uncharacterized lipoprotein YddW (UPF0748 family)
LAIAGLLFTFIAANTPANAQMIIVDNTHDGFSVLSGTWSTFDATGQWLTDYRHKSTDDAVPAVAEWRPEIPETGSYEVAVWYRSTGTSRPSDATYTVNHAGGPTNVVVNQQVNGSTWFVLGTFTFNAGSSGSVTLTSAAEPGKIIVADAMSFRGAGEWRAMWAYSWGSGFLNATQTTNMINTLSANNYNVIVPEVRKAGDAYYNSAYEPQATNVASGYDALADMITKAHAANIEVHPWIVTYRIWNTGFPAPPASHIFAQHPDWLMTDNTGNVLEGSNYYLDPGIPAVQDYVVAVAMDIVNNYDVDGLNLDYIRYQGSEWGYNAISEQRFFDEFGEFPPTSSASPLWSAWGQWRRNQVTDLVRKIYVNIQASKPHVVLTGDGITWGALNGFTGSDTYNYVFQDWRGWMEEGIVDALLPMNYKNENTHASQYRDWAQYAVENKGDRHAYIGQGCYLNTVANTLAQMLDVRAMGADGHCQYQYQSTNDGSSTDAQFFSTMKTQLYSSPAPTPLMPWKETPTQGILAGTITDAAQPNDPIYGDRIYQATIDLSGPETRSVLSDGTGFYAFLKLTPGQYSVTVTKSGFAPVVVNDITVSAGNVNLTDVALGDGPGSCQKVLLTDFEGYPTNTGADVMFRSPTYSGSTTSDLALSPDEAEVTADVTAYEGSNVSRVEWQWVDTDLQRWLRLTTSNVATLPNPTVDFARPVRFRVRLDSGAVRICIGVRETSASGPIGSDGGTSGTIEWVGAGSTVSGSPQGVLVSALPGQWQTLTFEPQLHPVTAMTGDGVLSSATGMGTLEHIALASTGDAGPHTLYIDYIEQLCVPGDYDGDNIADLADFQEFGDCMTGPDAGSVDPTCTPFDIDEDNDVDAADFAQMQWRLGS